MEPPTRESVKTMDSHLWTLGSALMCVKMATQDAQPHNSIVSWQDGDSTFHLLPRDDSVIEKLGQGDPVIDRIQDCGSNGALWAIGNEVICKVKSWAERRQRESSTIEFVRENFSFVPLPEVIYSSIDRSIHRTFMLMKRVHARTLNTAWSTLSRLQQQNIANKMAEYCATIAQKTSPRYESTHGSGVLEYWLMGDPPASRPSWLPMLLGPLTGPELKRYMSNISNKPVPHFEDVFHFYHCDLGPTNILVSDDGDSVAAIIDWEAAAYFPSFWVAT
jgi:hypothetical protein